MIQATKISSNTKPFPQNYAVISISIDFCSDDSSLIKNGYIPIDMDDHWFLYFEKSHLYFHRSWTGFCIYIVKIEEQSDKLTMSKVWINQDPSQYNENNLDPKYHSDLIIDIIDNLILKNPRK